MDLFSVILSSGISWSIHKLLDSFVECRCGSTQTEDVTNVDYNAFRCRDCGRNLNEYINATDHTINRNKSIVAAKLGHIHWPTWRDNFKIYYDFDVINSKYQEVVVELTLSEFRGSVFERYESIKKPRYELSTWSDSWINIPRNCFPIEACTFAADLKIYNVWGDLLDAERLLGDYSGRE
jgi:hypothetical protein